METSKKRSLEDNEHKPMTYSSKRRRQHQASDTGSPAHALNTSHPSIATSPPTLIGSPAPLTPSRSIHPSTPSYTSSISSSESESDTSSSSSEETNSIDYASTSSADSRTQQARSHQPSLLPRMLSPSTTSSGTSTDSGSYTSASISDEISDLLSSSSDASSDDESVSTSSGSSSSDSGSSDSALSSFSSAHASQPPHLSVASLTADNLSHLQTRLNALLPKIKSANEVLESERREGRLEERNIENVTDGEREGGYIEMNLGLGVLEEKTKGGAQGYRERGDESEGERGDGGGLRAGDVLDDMMGKKRPRGKGKGKVGIEEVRN